MSEIKKREEHSTPDKTVRQGTSTPRRTIHSPSKDEPIYEPTGKIRPVKVSASDIPNSKNFEVHRRTDTPLENHRDVFPKGNTDVTHLYEAHNKRADRPAASTEDNYHHGNSKKTDSVRSGFSRDNLNRDSFNKRTSDTSEPWRATEKSERKPGRVEENFSDKDRTLRMGASSLNRYTRHRDFLNKAVYQPVGTISRSARQLVKTAATASEDQDARQTIISIEDHSRPGVWAARAAVRVLGANGSRHAAVSAIRDYERDVVHGDALEKVMRSPEAKKMGVFFDSSRLTIGDVKAFKTIEKTLDGRAFQELSKEEIESLTGKVLQVRQAANEHLADGGILSRKNGKGVKVRNAIRMNAGETTIRTLVNEKKIKSLLTSDGSIQKEVSDILKDENSLLYVRTYGDYAKRMHIVNSVLRDKTLFGAFAEIDWNKLADKDISNMLKGKFNWALLGQNGKRIEAEFFKNRDLVDILSIRLGLSRGEHIRREFFHVLEGGAKGAVSFSLGKMIESGLERDTQRTLDVYGHFGRAGVTTVRAGYHGGRFVGKSVRKTGSVAMTGAENALNATGHQGAAEVMKEIHKLGGGVLDAPGYAYRKAKALPEKAVRKTASAAGSGLGKGARALNNTLTKRSATYRSAKSGVIFIRDSARKVGNSVYTRSAPVRKAYNAISKKVFRPITRKVKAFTAGLGKGLGIMRHFLVGFGVGIGIFLLLMLITAAIASGGANNSAIAGVFLDSEEHLKDFQARFDSLEGQFEQSINNIVNGYAQTTDLQGKKIKYGVQSEASSHRGVMYSFYDFAGNPTSVSSNIEDIMSCLAVVMQQDMQAHHQEALELMDAFYHSSHQFNYAESAMYACDNGDKVTDASGTVLKNDDGTDKTTVTFNCADAYKDDVDGLKCKPYFRLLNEPADSIFSNKFNSFNRNYEEFDKIVSEKTGVDPVLGTKGCQKMPVPDGDQAAYQSVETRTTKNTYYYYENKNGDERKSDIEIGYPESNPSINKSVNNRSYHNGGEGALLLWDPIDYGDSSDYEDYESESGACRRYYIDSTELSDITGYALMEYRENKDGDSSTTVISMDSKGQNWFNKLKSDLQDNARLDGDYSGAPFDVGSLPSWLTDGSCVDKDGNSMIGAYPYKGFGETESKSGVTKYKSGLMGYVFYCKGHDHYECPGHTANICYGHVDLYMNVRIATMDELFNLGGVSLPEEDETSEETGGEEN